MPVDLHILDARKRLSQFQRTAIERGVREGVARIEAHHPVSDIDLIVQLADFQSYNGRAYGAESAILWFNPDAFEVDEDTYLHVAHLTAHELHHVIRWASLKIKTHEDWTVGEVLVLEGMSTQAEDMLGLPPSNAVMDLPRDLVLKMLEKIAPDIAKPYAQVRWIDDALQPPAYPHRTASALGHVLCEQFLEATGETAMSAIHTRWQDVWDAARSGSS